MRALTRIARLLFGDYSLYYIYRYRSTGAVAAEARVPTLRVTEGDLIKSDRRSIADQAWYVGPECDAFGLTDERGLCAVCFYWYGDRYGEMQSFWPLAAGEAKLVQILVDQSARGRGFATSLIEASASAMASQGWSTLYARIWHSNQPSLRAFDRAGWTRVAFVVELLPFGMSWKLRLRIPLRRGRD